jgi:hypothetical protein
MRKGRSRKCGLAALPRSRDRYHRVLLKEGRKLLGHGSLDHISWQGV